MRQLALVAIPKSKGAGNVAVAEDADEQLVDEVDGRLVVCDPVQAALPLMIVCEQPPSASDLSGCWANGAVSESSERLEGSRAVHVVQ